ncbi:hypothetical protein BJD99_01020 [Rhodococcus sp. 1163]|uniref:hypothetical protein n=1 Tax=Rhodococcus sp. 1163 TaxID=1905289 RepID=UPI0009FEAB00|nr:hypothetical protein [Rhodococcus sp. 1163]ORI11753.1 hypothetical protein BJD99_01020 [Rhodococcus sp. 1163]
MTTTLIGKEAGAVSAHLVILIRSGQLEEAQKVINTLGYSNLRAVLIESLVSQNVIAGEMQAKVTQLQKNCLTILSTYAMQRQAALHDK